METTWLIQSNLISDAQQRDVCFAAQEIGARVIEATILPFVEDIEIHGTITTDKVIPYGSTKLTRLAQTKQWRGVFFDNIKFDVRSWVDHRNDMLNEDVLISSFNNINSHTSKFSLYDDVFIRPCKDLKAFNGGTMSWANVLDWAESIEFGNFTLDPATHISISPIKNIQAEWRYFVVDGKIVSGSMYKHKGKLVAIPELDEHVLSQAQRFADKWLPCPVCVMDLALTDDELKVIEFNSFNSTGFYEHDVKKIVSSVTNYMENAND